MLTEKRVSISLSGVSAPSEVPSEVPTLQAVDEPHELFLGDVGVAQVQGHRLSPDDAAQHGGGDGALAAQVNLGPQPLVTTPGGKDR